MGDTEESPLRVEEEVEEIPCGHSVVKKYIDASGTLVRQDTEIRVKKGFSVDGKTGGFFRRVIDGAKEEYRNKRRR